jgi:pimeloyl-ACP methyl ester carboxylesterase
LGATGVVALLAPLTVAAFGYDLVGGGVLAPAPLGANGHVLTAGGLTTRYEQWGSTGTPVVLVHGFLESAWVWHEVGPLLASRGYRVYAIDVRGYGYTSRTGPYTLAGDTAQLQTFLAALHLDAAHHAAPVLVGHSSGAAIVGNLARTDPAAVAAVAFMDGDGTPYGVGPGWVHRLFVDPYATALIRLVTHHPSLAGRAYRGACSASCPPFDASAWVRPMRVAGAESALKAILRQPLIGMTYAQERSMHVKAAVIYGTDDPEMTAGDAEATASRLHTHLVVPLPGAPHLGMLSSPTATAEAIARVAAP